MKTERKRNVFCGGMGEDKTDRTRNGRAAGRGMGFVGCYVTGVGSANNKR